VNGDGAVYFDPKDVVEMAKMIDNVLSSNVVRNQLIKKGQIQAAKYSWARMAKQTLEVYNRALK
jgi:glycosyltransferase involved in cell wall biosynthesis